MYMQQQQQQQHHQGMAHAGSDSSLSTAEDRKRKR